MLPKESIRFFKLDHQWIDCLLDGAFSIGRIISSDHAHDNRMHPIVAGSTSQNITGFLLRSDLVSGWPSLLLEAYDHGKIDIPDEVTNPTQTPLAVLRREKLSENVLLCMFEGEIKTLDIHQKPEALHFGVDINPSNGNTSKDIFYVDADGKETRTSLTSTNFPWSNESRKTIKIADQNTDTSTLSKEIETKLSAAGANITNFTSAQFAMAMIEGVEKVRFRKKGS